MCNTSIYDFMVVMFQGKQQKKIAAIGYLPYNFAFNLARKLLKVIRSRNIKQKIYEILTFSKIQMNGVILNNCID